MKFNAAHGPSSPGLLQDGPAVSVAGDVGGGILFDARPAGNSTTDTDEDDDGILDARRGPESYL